MDFGALKFWLDLVNFAVLWGISLYLYISRKNQVTADRLERFRATVGEAMSEQGERLTRAEAAIQHGPQHDDMQRVYARLDEVSQKLADLTGEFRAVRRTLELISQHMMDHRS